MNYIRSVVIVGLARFFHVVAPAQQTERPNIIVILADDMGYSGIRGVGVK